jgi:hypothetical protein
MDERVRQSSEISEVERSKYYLSIILAYFLQQNASVYSASRFNNRFNLSPLWHGWSTISIDSSNPKDILLH